MDGYLQNTEEGNARIRMVAHSRTEYLDQTLNEIRQTMGRVNAEDGVEEASTNLFIT